MSKQIWKAKDGSEHVTQAAAERRDMLRAAQEELAAAGRAFQTILGRAVLTADGHPLEFGYFHREFWYVTEWRCWPVLQRVRLSWGDVSIELEDYMEEPKVILRWHDRHGRSSTDQIHHIDVSQLYVSEVAARERHLQICLESLELVKADLAAAVRRQH